MVEEKVIQALCKFGGYVFNPVTPKVLLENNVFKTNGLFPGLSVDDNGPLYIIGLAVNRVFRKNRSESQYPPRLQPIDDFTVNFPYDTIMPTSFVFVYGDSAYTETGHRPHPYWNYHVQIWKEDTTRLLESLIRVAGVRHSFEKGVDSTTVRKLFVQYDSVQGSLGPVQPTEKLVENVPKVPEAAPLKSCLENVHLSRKEILDLLKTERECVIRAETCDRDCSRCPLVRDSKKLIAMYGTVIKTYEGAIRQNSKGKCVRMADGSRKWLPNDMAVELLKLPREQRVHVKILKGLPGGVSKDVVDAVALTAHSGELPLEHKDS